MTNFDLSPAERSDLWHYLGDRIDSYLAGTRSLRASPDLDVKAIRRFVQSSFDAQTAPREALDHVLDGLIRFSVHTPHPGYFGLFNPRATYPSTLADAIAAAFNSQLAAWSHAPFANEVEQSLIHAFGKKFGYSDGDIDGNFTSGGAEANTTGLLLALNRAFPEYANEGLQSLGVKPVLYCSSESHHSLVKAARIAGIGMNAVRQIPVDDKLRMSVPDLEDAIRRDLAAGSRPFLIVATAGTTGAGAIDPLTELAAIAQRQRIWLHTDAAYGGALIILDREKELLKGIELSDSITFDAHKWLSVSMAGSMLITRQKNALAETFRITADYMPQEASALTIVDPYTHSIQWSRRFIGLKVYLSMLIFGWEGYGEVLRHQIAMGALMKSELVRSGWRVFNDTELPILCFGKDDFVHDQNAASRICGKVLATGKHWISVYNLRGVNTLRACVTNFATTEADVRGLVKTLDNISRPSYH